MWYLICGVLVGCEAQMLKRFLSKFAATIIIFDVLFLCGCYEDQTLVSFTNDMSGLVQIEVPFAGSLEDPCMIANGIAAARWYSQLQPHHRETLRENIQRYVKAVKFVKPQILSDVPAAMAKTTITYNRGTILVATKGVRNSVNNEIICAPDIDVLIDFTVTYRAAN